MQVIIQTGLTPDWAAPLRRPWPLLPVGNRPWVEFWIEWCAAQGLSDIHIVLGDGAYEIEHDLGDGQRWGINLRYSFLRNPEDPDSFLKRDPARWKDGLLHVRHPVFPARASAEPPAPLPDYPCASGAADNPDVVFLPAGAKGAAQPFPESVLTARPLGSLQDYFDLNMAMADGAIARYLTPGYRRQDHAYLGYNVVYPASARLTAPVMIGNDVRLIGLSSVGPRALLGNRVIVDRQAEVTDSIVLDGTYLGAGIELKGRIAAGRRLIDPSDGTALDLDAPHLLAPLRAAGAHGEWLRRQAHRGLALLLFLGAAPFAIPGLALALLLGGRMGQERMLGVRGPCTVERWRPGRRGPGLFTRLSFDRWPPLLRVVRGQLWLCGQQPVKPDEEGELQDWPTYRPALFTYADTRPAGLDPVMRRLDANYYAHHRGWGEDTRILLRGWWSRLVGRNRPANDYGVPA